MNYEEAHIQAHERAIANQTAESYLLDDLSDAERDAFEEHYFDCIVCADTVRAGATMFASAREAISEEPKPVPFIRRVATWFPQVAAAALVVAIGIQFFPKPEPEITIVTPRSVSTEVRGANDNAYKLGKDEELALAIYVPPGLPYRTYEIGVRTAKGKTIDTKTISAETAKSTQLLLLRKLPAGSYVLVIEGVREDGNRAPITRSVFTVQR